MNILIGILIAIGAFITIVVMTVLSMIGTVLSFILTVIGLPILLAIAYITKDKE